MNILTTEGQKTISQIQAATLSNTTRVTSGSHSPTISEDILFLDTDSNDITVYLPAGVSGKHYKLINCGSSGNSVIVTPDGSEKVNGASTQTLYDGDIYDIHFESVEGWWG